MKKFMTNLFVRMSGLTLCSESSLHEFDISRVGGAFVVRRIDAITNTTLNTWAIGEIRGRVEISAKRRFALIKLLPGGEWQPCRHTAVLLKRSTRSTIRWNLTASIVGSQWRISLA